LKSEFWDASHHCYGYRLDPEKTIEFSSDDGEPSGTGGLPILNELRSNELIDIGSVVIRYFGGTKLGKAGLIESYGEGARQAVSKAELLKIKRVQFLRITYPYNQENVINKLFLDHELVERSAEYLSSVSKEIACPIEHLSQFEENLEAVEHLGIQAEMLHKSYIYV
jgi:uncharacterized YigZ family protein